MAKSVTRPFGVRDKVGYLFGDFGCNLSFQLLSGYLMLYVTQGMGLTTGHWAIIVLVAKIFDAINDPIIGALVDSRKPGKNGKYRPWIFWGSFAIAITTMLLFIDFSSFPYWGRFAYCLIMYCLWSIAYTAANVPYGSLNAALTDDPGQRASLSSLRSIGAGIAVMPLTVLIPMIGYGEKVPGPDGNMIQLIKPEVFFGIAAVCGIVGILGFMLTVFLTKERQVVAPSTHKINYFRTLKNFVKNRAALGISLASFAQLVFVMSYSTVIPLVCQFYFGDGQKSGVLSLIMMLPMMVVIPFMGKLTKKFGKREISLWPNLVCIVVLLILLVIPLPAEPWAMWVYAGFFGVTMLVSGPFMLGNWSMVADCVDAQEIQTGTREEASVYATYSLARKMAQGVGAAFVALCLGWVGYNAEAPSSTTSAAAAGIMKLSIILPLIGYALIFVSLFFLYNLSKAKVEENGALLRAKRAAEAGEGGVSGEIVADEVAVDVPAADDAAVEGAVAEEGGIEPAGEAPVKEDGEDSAE